MHNKQFENVGIFQPNTYGCLNSLETNFYYGFDVNYEMIYNHISKENRKFIPSKNDDSLYQLIRLTMESFHKNDYKYKLQDDFDGMPKIKPDDFCEPNYNLVQSIVKKARQNRRYTLPSRDFMRCREVRKIIPFTAGIEIEKLIHFVCNNFQGYSGLMPVYESQAEYKKYPLLIWITLITLVKDKQFKRWMDKTLKNVSYDQIIRGDIDWQFYFYGTIQEDLNTIVSLRNQLYPSWQRNTLEKVILRDMWLLKNIYFSSNGINRMFQLMSSYMCLNNVELVFKNGKILKFNPDRSELQYNPIKVIKHFFRPIRMMDQENIIFYEYDQQKVLDRCVYLTANKREYSEYVAIQKEIPNQKSLLNHIYH